MCYKQNWHFLCLKQEVNRTTEGATDIQLVESVGWTSPVLVISASSRDNINYNMAVLLKTHKLQSCTDLQIACWLKKVSMQALAS